MQVGLAGLGYWGPNLARNFDDLAELTWLCDLSPDLLDQFGARCRRSHDAPVQRSPRGTTRFRPSSSPHL